MKIENIKYINELIEELKTKVNEHPELLDEQMVENEEEIEKIADELKDLIFE